MKSIFIYTITKFNSSIETSLKDNINVLNKNKFFELVILSCIQDKKLDELIYRLIQQNSDIKYYKPQIGTISPAYIKNFYLKLADNKFLTFLREDSIINTYFLLNLATLNMDKIMFADDNRYGLFLTAHRDVFLKIGGFDVTLFSTSLNCEDDDIKNRIVFSRAAEPKIILTKSLAAINKIILHCDTNEFSNYDNFTSFKNVSNKIFFLPEVKTCTNIVFNFNCNLN